MIKIDKQYENYGLKLGGISPLDYKWGTLSGATINQNGDWTDYLPIYEPQMFSSGEDPDGCHIWGTQNCLETYLKLLTNKNYNFSERVVYIGTNSTKGGGDPFQSGEWMRKNGVVDEEVLPMTTNYADYIVPNPLPQYILDRCRLFIDEFEIKQEYVWNDLYYPLTLIEKQSRVTEALKLSPLGVSVPAWVMDSDGNYFRPAGMQDNHWCMLFKETESVYYIFDSYDQSIKTVRKDINPMVCIRYQLSYKQLQKKTWWSKLIAWIKHIYEL